MKGSMQQLMKQANQLQLRMKKLQAELAEKRYEGSSGGGVVKVTVKGEHTLESLVISEEVFKEGDREMLQDLILTAANEALKTAKEESAKAMEELTGNANLAGLF